MYPCKRMAAIDNISFSIFDPPLKWQRMDQPFLHYGVEFYPVYNRIHRCFYSFSAEHHNLRLKYYPSSGMLMVSNSIHKYAKGNNYTDFTLSETKHAFQKLQDELHMNVMKAELKDIEYACVIQHESDFKPYYGLQSYKGRAYLQMQAKGQQYGLKCSATEYDIKGYNKTFQVKAVDKVDIDINLFRWEMHAKRMRYLHNKKPQIPIYKIEDLLNTTNMQYLADDLCRKYKDSMKAAAVNFSSFSNLGDIDIILRMRDPEVVKHLKQHHNSTYRRNKRKYEKLIKDFSTDYMKAHEQLQEKCMMLINS
jgi:hypothetical protein